MRPLFLAIVLFLFLQSSSLASVTVTMDSEWWASIPQSARVYVVQALITSHREAYSQGFGTGVFDMTDLISDLNRRHVLSDAQYEKIDFAKVLVNGHSDASFSKTFGRYERLITDYYSDHPHSKYDVGFIIGCLADRPKMKCQE